MHTGRGKILTGVLAVIAVFMLAAVAPAFSDDSSATAESVAGTQLMVVYDGSVVDLQAGSTSPINFSLYSNYGDDTRMVFVTAVSDNSLVTFDKSDAPLSVPANDYLVSNDTGSKNLKLKLYADRYAHQGAYAVTLQFLVIDGSGINPDESGEYTFQIAVHSYLTSDKYNKFLGFIPNTLEGFMGEAWFAALVSVAGLLAIGYAIMFVAVPVCSCILMKKDDPERKKLKTLLYRLCHVIVILWVIGQVFRILGVDESLIDFINRLFYLTYVIVGIIVAWKLWKLIVDTVIKRIFLKSDEFTKGDAAADFDSFRPLFLYIGEIFLAIIGTMLIMGLLGFNLTAIITSAGLVSLGISMGAQDVLKQFFSGLEILATRPFKRGDLVTVGTDTAIYRVRRVNVMNTFLENWDNTDVTVMPNSLLTTNKIKNITRDTVISKVYITVEVGYGTDVDLARRLMQEAASENGHVITDGSVKRPYTRLEAFNDSNLLIKMGFYVDEFGSQWAISGQIRQTIIKKFAANGVNIDYTQIVIHEAKAPTSRSTAAEAKEDVE